jgi:hypothetical protein
VAYFSNHICPDRFSLTNEEAKKNDFYEVHIYVPDASNDEIAKIPRKNHWALRIKCEFMPIKNSSRWGNILAGKIKNTDAVEFSEGLLSSDYLRYSRIDVNYYFGHLIYGEKGCSVSTLAYLFILRSLKFVYISIVKQNILKYFRKLTSRQKLRVPLKSKYEIYEALMNNDNVLREGTFTKRELSDALFGNNYVDEYSVYQKLSKSLDWILDACIEDGEMKKVENHDDSLYEIKGKGIHYFTLTQESLKNEEANKLIQQQQKSIQNKMLLLTVFLVIGTFLSAIDKITQIKTFMVGFISWLNSLIEMAGRIFT